MSGFRCRIGTFRCVYGVAFFVFIADRRDGLYDLDLAVTAHARTSRDEFTDDDVFFEAQERVDLAFDSGIGQDTSRFLKDAADRKESVASAALVIPRSIGLPIAGLPPLLSMRLFISSKMLTSI